MQTTGTLVYQVRLWGGWIYFKDNTCHVSAYHQWIFLLVILLFVCVFWVSLLFHTLKTTNGRWWWTKMPRYLSYTIVEWSPTFSGRWVKISFSIDLKLQFLSSFNYLLFFPLYFSFFFFIIFLFHLHISSYIYLF